jgi:hypothetical protein
MPQRILNGCTHSQQQLGCCPSPVAVPRQLQLASHLQPPSSTAMLHLPHLSAARQGTDTCQYNRCISKPLLPLSCQLVGCLHYLFTWNGCARLPSMMQLASWMGSAGMMLIGAPLCALQLLTLS